MKLAIPTKKNQVDSHFGHCDHYTIYTIIDKNTISETELYEAPQGCGCKSNVAAVLAQKGVTILLAGNMGDGAVRKIQEQKIKVIRGCEGDVETLAKNYLNGQVSDSGELCSDHGDDHECSSNTEIDTATIKMV